MTRGLTLPRTIEYAERAPAIKLTRASVAKLLALQKHALQNATVLLSRVSVSCL
jgi:hypothetical protein